MNDNLYRSSVHTFRSLCVRFRFDLGYPLRMNQTIPLVLKLGEIIERPGTIILPVAAKASLS